MERSHLSPRQRPRLPSMRTVILTVVLLALLVFGVAVGAGVRLARLLNAEPPIGRDATLAQRDLLFQMHCARCHGEEGHGDAIGTERMFPPPRDFAARPWRFEVTRDSIERVITEGIPGTSMPAFGPVLPPGEIEALTEHVLMLAGDGSSAGDSPPDAFQAAGFVRLAERRAASELRLETADGEEITLEALRGKVVLLNFWGISCEHCLTRMPRLTKLAERLASEELVVVNVCADSDDPAEAQSLLGEVAPQLVSYVDATGLANGKYEVSLLPTIWLVDRQGQLVARRQGACDWDSPAVQHMLQQLLDEAN